MTVDPLDRMERAWSPITGHPPVGDSRDVLALVRAARAAREAMDKAPALMSDNPFARALNDLAAALAELAGRCMYCGVVTDARNLTLAIDTDACVARAAIDKERGDA